MSSSTERQNMVQSTQDIQEVLAGIVNSYDTDFHTKFKKVLHIVTMTSKNFLFCIVCDTKYMGTKEEFVKEYSYEYIFGTGYMWCPHCNEGQECVCVRAGVSYR